MHTAPRQLADGAPHHLRERFRGAGRDGPYRWHAVPHHLAHAASAFFVSPFPEAAVMTLDGRGERATTSYAVGRGTTLEPLGTVEMPHSLGLLYEQVTSHLGFLHSSDEYKVMALASFGSPLYENALRDHIELDGNGGYRIREMDLARSVRSCPGSAAAASSSAITTWPVRSRSCSKKRCWSWRAGSTRRREWTALCMAGGVALELRDELRASRPRPF